jgi:NAD(P)-dependent dehydrogenase (short-subunit alcohol dehydrogenase family)
MRLALFLPTQPTEMWRLALQLGVTDAVTGLPQPLPGGAFVWDFSSLLHLKQRFADAGLNLSVIESSPPMDLIRLGLPGRDEEIEQICQLLTNMGAVGIRGWCYNFMAGFGWFRTSTTTKATAVLLAQQGARVAALSHTAHEVEQTAVEIESEGKQAMAVVGDTTQEAQMQRAVQQLIDRWGRIDIVFANAGIYGMFAPIEEFSLADWSHTITTNLTGTFLTVKYTVPHLKKQGGSLIITSSVNGTRVFSNTGATAYSATKAGQVAMAKMLAVELGPHNIGVNVICPGSTITRISDNTQRQNLERIRFPVRYPRGPIPLGEGKPATAEQVAQLVLFLVSDAASHITGTEVWIDGGSSLITG